MTDKILLSNKDIRYILDDDTITVNSMGELVNAIKKDPNSKRLLRRFLVDHGVSLDVFEERLEYLKNHFYIESEGPVNESETIEAELPTNKQINGGKVMADMLGLSNEDIKVILDDTITVNSMGELINAIKKDPNAKRGLRKFLAAHGAFLDVFEERLEYLKNHFYIESETIEADNADK